jgi:ABC-type branched-subunit amino acid transport system substrate-binding protein
MRKTGTAALAALTVLLAGCAGQTAGATGSGGGGGKDAAAAPGWDPATKTITVGALYPTSGPFANTIQDIIGMRAYFHRATAKGGVLDGYKVEVKNADTQYNVTTAIPLYQQLKDQVAIFGNLGGFISDALPLAKDDKLTVTPLIVDIKNPNILPVFPNYEILSANAVAHAAEQDGGKDATYCTLKMDGAFGDQAQFGVDSAVKKLGLKYGTTATFPSANPQDLTAQVVTLRDAGCSEVILGGTFAMQQAAARAAQLGWNAHWTTFAPSYVSDIATGTAADYIKRNVTYVHTGTDWDDDSVKGQVDLRKDVEAVQPGSPPALVTYETGYVSAMVMADVLKKALDNGDMSPKGILKASTEIGEVDMKGLGGGGYDYGTGPDTRKPPRAVTIFEVTDKTKQGVQAVKTGYTSEAGDSVGFLAHK